MRHEGEVAINVEIVIIGLVEEVISENVYSWEFNDDNPDSLDMCKDKVAANV